MPTISFSWLLFSFKSIVSVILNPYKHREGLLPSGAKWPSPFPGQIIPGCPSDKMLKCCFLFVSFVFKNAVVGDFRYIVSSAQLLIGNLSGLQTNLAAGGDPSRGGGALCRTSSVLVYYPKDGTA